MYPDNINFAILTLNKPRHMVVTDGVTLEDRRVTTVSRIHFRNASENTPDGSFVSWRGYEGKNVTITFVGGEPELYSTEGGEPLDAVGYMGVNVKIHTN